MGKLPTVRPIPPQPTSPSPTPEYFIPPPSPSTTVYVDVYLANNLTIVSPGGKMHYDTFDGPSRPSLFDTANFWFVSPALGRYHFDLGIGISAAPIALYTIDLILNVGNVLRRRIVTENNPSANNINIGGSTTLPLNIGDQVYVNFTNTSGVNITALGGITVTWIQITRVSDL